MTTFFNICDDCFNCCFYVENRESENPCYGDSERCNEFITVPKTHYRWIPWGRDSAYNKYYRCSNCKHEIIVYSDDMYGEIEIPNTCEHCGAKMVRLCMLGKEIK